MVCDLFNPNKAHDWNDIDELISHNEVPQLSWLHLRRCSWNEDELCPSKKQQKIVTKANFQKLEGIGEVITSF